MQHATRRMAVMILTVLAGCGGGGSGGGDVTATNIATGVPKSAEPAAVPEYAEMSAADQQRAEGTREFFLGTWTGPEGLSFVVEAKPDGGYRIRNRDTLDSETTFDGGLAGETLRFVRRGETLSARPGTGAETGYKWLAQKKDCLIVQAGVEGYCRD
ncbi:MAG TPA: hypothetical protein VF649_03520 [Sphingomonas sp.]|jgi:hypothetical protein|uniref:hypothetical protein n=1 Tax=Sphingomonas sp. TaxID=28214 RepID=UPI002ED9D7E8